MLVYIVFNLKSMQLSKKNSYLLLGGKMDLSLARTPSHWLLAWVIKHQAQAYHIIRFTENY